MRYVISLVLAISAVSAYAEETLVAVDTAGRVQTVTVELEAKLHLFTDYPEFREARLYRSDDSTFTLEISYRKQALELRERKPLTAAEALELQRKISHALYARVPEVGLDQSGRTKLVVGQTIAGVVYYDWMIPVATGAGGEDFSALYWLTGGLNYLVPFLLTRHAEVTRAGATMWLYGATRGPWHGAALWVLLTDEAADGDERSFAALATLAGYGEATGLYLWADRKRISDGRAATIGVGGDFGAGAGIAVVVLITPNDDSQSEEAVANRLAGLGLVGSVGGMIAANQVAVKSHYTRGDAYIVRATGYLGAGVPMLLLGAADVDDGQVYAATGIAGLATGLTVGHFLIKDNHADTDDGKMAMVGMIAGAMAGLGIGLIAGDNDNNPAQVGSAVGAVAGFLLTYRGMFRSHALSRFEPELMAGVMPNQGKIVPALSLTISGVPFLSR